MDFEFSESESPRYFYGNDAFLSHFWNTFSSLLPAGESFFVQAVRHYRDQVTDPVLKAQVAGFIGQEAMHSKEHLAFNTMIASKGLPMEELQRDVSWFLETIAKYAPKSLQLAATVCLEHYTAIIAEQLLREPEHQRMLGDFDAKKLWLWHALEENEHKTVAYDLYESTVGSYWLRAGTMVPTTLILAVVLVAFQTRMMAADGQLFKLKQNAKGFAYLWSRKGLFPRLAPQFFDFFRRDFHPSQHDTDALLMEWKEKLLGSEGLLKDSSFAKKAKAAA
ncbi:Predicted metal-dependent hydrolase [gamma proteobacterium HdN1]|nr:Predicted metal-dependent hydrolase [gamma proteobacterium HdN1]